MSDNMQTDYMSDYMPETRKTTPPNLPIFIILILILCICITLSALFVTGKIPINRDNNQTTAIEESPQPLPSPIAQSGLADFGDNSLTSAPTTIPTPLNAQPTPAPTTPRDDAEWIPVPSATPTPVPTSNTPISTSTQAPALTTNTNSRVNAIKTYLNGTLHLQGDIADNADILVLVRPAGSSDYQAVQRIKAARTTNWTWNGATPGTTYEVTFAYQINQNNVRSAPVGTAKAPASIETWMNTGSGDTASSSDNNNNSSTSSTSNQRAGIPRLVSCDNYADGKYSANLKFPKVDGAQQYLVQVGTSANAVDFYDQHLDPQNGDLYVRLNFENDKPYYLRYSYANCRDCGNSFQGQSVTVEVKCQKQ